jgi:hypothetical protein
MAEERVESTPDTSADRGPLVPVEVEIYVEPDGSVTFADLAEGLLPVVDRLDSSASRPAGPDSGSTPVGGAAVDASP